MSIFEEYGAFNALSKTVADDIIFFKILFFMKIRLGISCELSAGHFIKKYSMVAISCLFMNVGMKLTLSNLGKIFSRPHIEYFS